MKLILRGDIWYYRFEVGGVEYFHTTKCRKTDKAEAKLVMEAAYREHVLGRVGIRRAPTLKGLAKAWLASHGRTKSAAHQRAARQALEALKPLHGLALTALTDGKVDGFLADYLQDHSPASANLLRRYLKLWLRWAQGEGYLRELPCKLKQPRLPDRERPVVKLDQVDTFLAACARMNPQIPVAVRCAMQLGLREAEILRLRWQDLGTDEVIVHGKGGKIRRVAIPAEVLAAFGWWIFGEGPGPVEAPRLGLVFPAEDRKPHRQGWLRQALARGAKALDIPVLGIHRLRATFVTLHLRKGTPLKVVQKMAGHSDPRTTLIYEEVSTEEQAQHQADLWKRAGQKPGKDLSLSMGTLTRSQS